MVQFKHILFTLNIEHSDYVVYKEQIGKYIMICPTLYELTKKFKYVREKTFV